MSRLMADYVLVMQITRYFVIFVQSGWHVQVILNGQHSRHFLGGENIAGGKLKDTLTSIGRVLIQALLMKVVLQPPGGFRDT